MRRLIIACLLMITATSFAGFKKYMEYSDATTVHDTDRIPIYQGMSGTKNLTVAGLKSVIGQTAWDSNYVKVFQANSSSTTAPNAGIKMVSVTRDRRGVINQINYENGGSLSGVPPYYHSYVYPFNNMTNVSRSTPIVIGGLWITRGFVGKNISITDGPALTIKGLYFAGKFNGLPNFGYVDENNTDQSLVDAFYWGTSSVGMLAANTTYTIRSAMAYSWSGPSGNSGYLSIRAPGDGNPFGFNPCTYVMGNTSTAKVMQNYSTNLCRSTFRTGN